MTIVAACICADDKVVVMSDSAITCENGYRLLTSTGKWWTYPNLVIGTSGDDLVLSRIKRKLDNHKKSIDIYRNPETFSDIMFQVQQEIRGEGALEGLEAELLHISFDKKGKPSIYVLGGEGGISGPFPYACVGDPSVMGMLGLNILLKPTRMKKRTVIKVVNAFTELMGQVASLHNSVESPFYHLILEYESS